MGTLQTCTAELLLLPDGRILAQNITPAMAEILAELEAEDGGIRQRTQRLRNAQSNGTTKSNKPDADTARNGD